MEVFDAYSGFVVNCIIVCRFTRVYILFVLFLYLFSYFIHLSPTSIFFPGVSSLPSPTETAVGQKAFPSLTSQPLSREPEDLVVPKVA